MKPLTLVLVKDPDLGDKYIAYLKHYPYIMATVDRVEDAPKRLACFFEVLVEGVVKNGDVVIYEDPHEGLGEK